MGITMLPFSLRVAAQAIELDHVVRTVPTNEELPVRITIKTLRYKGWEERLVEKAIKVLNSDINFYLFFLKNLTLEVYNLGGIYYNKGLFICTDMRYDLHQTTIEELNYDNEREI